MNLNDLKISKLVQIMRNDNQPRIDAIVDTLSNIESDLNRNMNIISQRFTHQNVTLRSYDDQMDDINDRIGTLENMLKNIENRTQFGVNRQDQM